MFFTEHSHLRFRPTGLDLFYNVVEVHIAGGATDETLKQVAKLTHLRSFSCVPNGFTDEGVAYLAALRNLKTLQLGVHSPILGSRAVFQATIEPFTSC